jgi:hypothetical protein
VRGQLVSKADFRGGVNLEAAPYFLGDTEARDLRNVVSTVRGAIRKRDGAQTLATLGTVLTSLFAALGPDVLVAAGGTVLYSITPGGVVTTIKTGVTNGARWSWVQAPASGGQGPLYGINGADAQQWDGVAASTSAWTAAAGTFPAGAKHLLYHGRRVFAAGMSSYAGVPDPGSTLVASNLGDPRDWPIDKIVQFDPGDGEAIAAIGTIGPYVVVAKPSKVWLVYDLDTLANRPLGKNVGCVAHRSMVETPFGTFFLGKDAVYRTDGSTVKPITAGRLTPLITSIPAGARSVAAAGWWNGHYYLSIPTSGSVNDLTVDYDTAHDSFWLHALAEAQWATWEQAGQSVLYGAKPDSSKIVDRAFVAGVPVDNGAAFTGYWKSPFYTFGDTVRRKRVRMIHFDGKGRIQVSAAKSFQRTSSLLADVDFAGVDGLYGVNDGAAYGIDDGTSFGGLADVGDARILTPGVARAWSVTVANEAVENFEIDSISFALTGRKD